MISVYGKLVQSVGFQPPFQSWVWGSNITGSCRAQLLDAIRLAPSPASVLMLATDGVWSDAPIPLDPPRDTGTFDVYKEGKPIPLGGWEVKEYPRGVFCGRPGIYFPLEPTDADLEKVRARGIGRKALYEQWQRVQDAFEAGKDRVRLEGAQRFIGALSGVSWSKNQGFKRSENYGEWIDWSSDITFDPRPKRERMEKDGRLTCIEYVDTPSVPYKKAMKTDEEKLLALAMLIASEQPDGVDVMEG